MRRIGHTRPVGTTWRMRLHSWDAEQHGGHPPRLGDLVWEDPERLERGFLVVGVEETRDPTRWRLVLERLDWQAFLSLPVTTDLWCFVRDRR